jgi:IS30 family transposase
MSYTHLSRDDRIRLDVLLRTGLFISDCAKKLGFSRQSVSSEVNRNGGRKKYNPYHANRKAKRIRLMANQSHRKWHSNNWYTKVTIRLLGSGWSPEQVTGRILLELDQKPFSMATIYNNVNPDKELSKLLPRKHNKYRRRKDGNQRKKEREELNPKRSIDMRPEIINTRERIGDWEADTIIGKERKSRVLTHVERKSGYLLANLLYDVTAEKISLESIQSFRRIPKNKQKTITYDNGTEFADWELTEQELGMTAYFAHPYHSWERGTNENTNGLIRRYFPKGTYFSRIKKEQLNYVVNTINHRPRKRLGYKTPYEVFHSVKLRVLI